MRQRPARPPHAIAQGQTWWTGGARTRRAGTRRAGVRAGVRAVRMYAMLGSAGARQGEEGAKQSLPNRTR